MQQINKRKGFEVNLRARTNTRWWEFIKIKRKLKKKSKKERKEGIEQKKEIKSRGKQECATC